MLSLRKPSAESINRFLMAQARLDFTYTAIGATAAQLPAGYVVDHTRIGLGEGESVFKAAVTALGRWEQFRLGWLEASPVATPLQTGEVVAVVACAIGLWWLNACRVVYVVDESGPLTKFGFAYGTLPAHAGSGEERFLIEWDHADDSVWYDKLARPAGRGASMPLTTSRSVDFSISSSEFTATTRSIGSLFRCETYSQCSF